MAFSTLQLNMMKKCENKNFHYGNYGAYLDNKDQKVSPRMIGILTSSGIYDELEAGIMIAGGKYASLLLAERISIVIGSFFIDEYNISNKKSNVLNELKQKCILYIDGNLLSNFQPQGLNDDTELSLGYELTLAAWLKKQTMTENYEKYFGNIQGEINTKLRAAPLPGNYTPRLYGNGNMPLFHASWFDVPAELNFSIKVYRDSNYLRKGLAAGCYRQLIKCECIDLAIKTIHDYSLLFGKDMGGSYYLLRDSFILNDGLRIMKSELEILGTNPVPMWCFTNKKFRDNNGYILEKLYNLSQKMLDLKHEERKFGINNKGEVYCNEEKINTDWSNEKLCENFEMFKNYWESPQRYYPGYFENLKLNEILCGWSLNWNLKLNHLQWNMYPIYENIHWSEIPEDDEGFRPKIYQVSCDKKIRDDFGNCKIIYGKKCEVIDLINNSLYIEEELQEDEIIAEAIHIENIKNLKIDLDENMYEEEEEMRGSVPPPNKRRRL